jgi:hypothetical protein
MEGIYMMDNDSELITMGMLLRLASDEHGRGPSNATVHHYVRDGLIHPAKGSTGRLLFKRSDAVIARQIYWERKKRHGAVGRPKQIAQAS